MRTLPAVVLSIVLSTACAPGGNSNLGSGGAPGSGGSIATGGQTGGGGTATGGLPGVGGIPGTGGVPGSGGISGSGGEGAGGSPGEPEWLPSWATTVQRTEESNKPTTALSGKTLRQFVWPTVSGSEIRIQLSNERGNGPVDIAKVHIANAKTAGDPNSSMGDIDAATDAAFTFGGMPNVTILAGETAWSDPLDFALEEVRLTAVTMQFGATVPSDITGHPGARTTSYIADGDVVNTEVIDEVETRERWYFIDAIEVMAPADAFAIALLGDSITDGYGTIDDFSRWSDFLTLQLKDDRALATTRSVLNFGMGANSLTSSGADQDSGVDRFRRDVLPRDKIKWLVVLEGVNDIVAGVQAQTIMDAYGDIIAEAEADGIEVFISPITPMNAQDSATRSTVNTQIRALGNYNAGVDFDLVLRDPANMNSTLPAYKNDDLHPSKEGYRAMGESVDLMLFYP